MLLLSELERASVAAPFLSDEAFRALARWMTRAGITKPSRWMAIYRAATRTTQGVVRVYTGQAAPARHAPAHRPQVTQHQAPVSRGNTALAHQPQADDDTWEEF